MFHKCCNLFWVWPFLSVDCRQMYSNTVTTVSSDVIRWRRHRVSCEVRRFCSWSDVDVVVEQEDGVGSGRRYRERWTTWRRFVSWSTWSDVEAVVWARCRPVQRRLHSSVCARGSCRIQLAATIRHWEPTLQGATAASVIDFVDHSIRRFLPPAYSACVTLRPFEVTERVLNFLGGLLNGHFLSRVFCVC